MIAGVMRLGDLPIGAVMRPRHEVTMIDAAVVAIGFLAALNAAANTPVSGLPSQLPFQIALRRFHPHAWTRRFARENEFDTVNLESKPDGCKRLPSALVL